MSPHFYSRGAAADTLFHLYFTYSTIPVLVSATSIGGSYFASTQTRDGVQDAPRLITTEIFTGEYSKLKEEF
jgi:hypothetical protein